MQNQLSPNQAEIQFLTLAYNRFYDIFAEVMDDSFWDKDSWYRFSKVKDGFGVYSELMNYEPLRWVLENMKISRPPMEAEIAKELVNEGIEFVWIGGGTPTDSSFLTFSFNCVLRFFKYLLLFSSRLTTLNTFCVAVLLVRSVTAPLPSLQQHLPLS